MAQHGRVIACHTEEEWKHQIELATQAQKLVIVDFTASWCPPCRIVAPIFAEISQEFEDIVFLKVDVDELSSVAEEYEVQAMPTFLFIKDEKVVHRIVGAHTKAALVSKINQVVIRNRGEDEDEDDEEDDEDDD